MEHVSIDPHGQKKGGSLFAKNQKVLDDQD